MRTNYASSIGRVGALAVALGIGCAVATPAGIAWATSESADSDSSVSTTEGSDTNGQDGSNGLSPGVQQGSPSGGSGIDNEPGSVTDTDGSIERDPETVDGRSGGPRSDDESGDATDTGELKGLANAGDDADPAHRGPTDDLEPTSPPPANAGTFQASGSVEVAGTGDANPGHDLADVGGGAPMPAEATTAAFRSDAHALTTGPDRLVPSTGDDAGVARSIEIATEADDLGIAALDAVGATLSKTVSASSTHAYTSGLVPYGSFGVSNVYSWCMARTNIDIDDELLAEAMRRFGIATKKEAVDPALRRLVGVPLSRDFLASLEGVGWEGDLEALRGERPGEF